MSDDIKNGPGIGDDDDLDFDMTPDDNGDLPWTDAGQSEEMDEADKKTQSAILRLAADRKTGQEAIAQIRREPDLIKRAKALAAMGAVEFPDEKMVKSGDQFIMQPQSTDDNRWAVFEAIFGDGYDRPHINTFSGRLVDWRGETVDERYPMVELVRAMAAAGLKGQSALQARSAFKEWAAMARHNDLVISFEERLVKWDGVKRLEGSIIDMFECDDTDTTRRFSVYLWLSIYNRIMSPGCLAPMVPCFFGAQNAGKSYFSKLICEEVIGSKKADAIQLDVSGKSIDFLREITGNSVIANIGEMTGFGRADLNRMKSFITATSDSMHHKYEGHFTQERQWITIMDGNEYKGLQRDDTGNRRFYPIFLGQLPDEGGKPAWNKSFKVDYSNFRSDFWQFMGECKAWMDHYGMEGYKRYVNDVSTMVAKFNATEMEMDRGTVADDRMDLYLGAALRKAAWKENIRWPHRPGTGPRDGVYIRPVDIVHVYETIDKRGGVMNVKHLHPKMTAMGAELARHIKQEDKAVYLFKGFFTVAELLNKVKESGWNNLYGQRDGEFNPEDDDEYEPDDSGDDSDDFGGKTSSVEDIDVEGLDDPHGGF